METTKLTLLDSLLQERRMPFQKFAEIDRVAFLADGSEKGKIAAIVNVITLNKVLIDGPTALESPAWPTVCRRCT